MMSTRSYRMQYLWQYAMDSEEIYITVIGKLSTFEWC